MALTISTEWCNNARINTHTSTSCSFLTPLNIFKPSKLSFNHKHAGTSNYRSFSWNSKKSLIGFKAFVRHAFPNKSGMPKQEEHNSGDEEEKWDYKKYQALLRGGEEVTSVLEEMIELLKDIAMDAQSEEVAVQIAAQGVVGRRVESLDSSFMMALDFMLGQSENEVSERKWLLEVIKDTVLSYMTRKLPPHVQVVAMLCRTPRKESRLELLRRVAGGGGTFDYETGGKVVLPKANLNDIANQADDLLESMEEKQALPDRRLLARLVLVREEARNMMGGGMLDERNHRGLSTLPQAEATVVIKLKKKKLEDLFKDGMVRLGYWEVSYDFTWTWKTQELNPFETALHGFMEELEEQRNKERQQRAQAIRAVPLAAVPRATVSAAETQRHPYEQQIEDDRILRWMEGPQDGWRGSLVGREM